VYQPILEPGTSKCKSKDMPLIPVCSITGCKVSDEFNFLFFLPQEKPYVMLSLS
jgi:hypothetical protein